MSDVGLTSFANEDVGATNSVDDGVPPKLEDRAGTRGGGGGEVSIVTSGADDDVATVGNEDSGATISADGVVPAELRDVVDAGGGGDA